MAYLVALHALAAVIWIGGLFFMVCILRPAAAAMPLAERLPLLSNAMGRFFLCVWIAIIVLLVTGNTVVFMTGGMAAAPLAGAHEPPAVPADQALEPWAQEVQTARPVTGAHVCSYLNA